MSETIGFIGLGNMGQPISTNILKAGFALRVYNRSAHKAQPLVEQGAQQVSRPRDVVEAGGIVVSMVANDSALESITLGEDGILARLGPGGVHISMSTIAPATARRLGELHAERECAFVTSPVFGRPEAAAAGKLWIVSAGPQAAKERVRPILDAIGQKTFDFGEAPESASLIYQNYGRSIANKQYTPVGFEMQLGLKDVNLALQTAAQSNVPMPLASLLHDRLLTGVAKGRAEMDWMALALGVSE